MDARVSAARHANTRTAPDQLRGALLDEQPRRITQDQLLERRRRLLGGLYEAFAVVCNPGLRAPSHSLRLQLAEECHDQHATLANPLYLLLDSPQNRRSFALTW